MHRLLAGLACVLGAVSAPAAGLPDINRIAFAGFTLGQTTLPAVERKLGAAVFVRTGEAGAYRGEICYRAGDVRIGFLTEELGGPQRDLNGFALSADTDAHCADWKRKVVPAIGPLRLGMRKPAFQRALGGPVAWEGETATFEQLGHHRTGRHTSDVVVRVIGAFEHGELARFEVWRLETN